MLAILRMKSVLSPSFFKPATNTLVLNFHSQNPVFFFSRNIYSSSSNPLRNSCYLLNPTNVSAASSLKPFKNPSQQIRSLQMEANSSNQQSGSGEIHVIVGPMFAGKTTTLLKRVKTECTNGRSFALIKSNKDNRYGLESVVSHDGEKLPCWPLANLSSFRQRIGPEAYDKLEVIGIDEAQFFEDLYDFCRKAADNDGKVVFVAGLDGDYLRRKFGSVLDIIPIADTVTKLTARCELCGKRAFFTLRKTEEIEKELIAGADVYMPVCRKHYISGQVVKEAARTVLDSSLKVQRNAVL